MELEGNLELWKVSVREFGESRFVLESGDVWSAVRGWVYW